MNLINLTIELTKCKTICFLCLKNQNNPLSIYTELEVRGEFFNFNLTLADMMKKLFPSHEILFGQACKDCTDLILKMYIKLHKYENNKTLLNFIVSCFENQLQLMNPKNMDKFFIKIDKPEQKKILEEKESTTIVNTPENISFHCKKCDMKFNSREALKEHKIIHKNANDAMICDTCGQNFKTSRSLKAHLKCHIEKKCPYCFKTLKSHSHYNVHIKSHKLGVKRKRINLYYNCNDCTYRTLNKKTLEAHINKVHLCIRPYVCQTCFKGFYKKSNLTEHLTTHLQIINKICEICGDSFVNQKTLMEHQRLHSNSKPYECDICSKKFVTSGRRSDHIKRTHMDKTVFCIFCDKKFSLKKELNRHVKKTHTRNTQPAIDNFEVNIPNYRFDHPMLPVATNHI
ncbi:unnamed protein product [Parnassius mnemosyne]|uniref:C2H2-type domain-containing protein n=1 Tax=Parnassius mnemosyne TaxID=213953 RepID=A0AAV1LIR5_9NEOP